MLLELYELGNKPCLRILKCHCLDMSILCLSRANSSLKLFVTSSILVKENMCFDSLAISSGTYWYVKIRLVMNIVRCCSSRIPAYPRLGWVGPPLHFFTFT